MKKLFGMINANRGGFIKKTLIVGGSLAALAIVGRMIQSRINGEDGASESEEIENDDSEDAVKVTILADEK